MSVIFQGPEPTGFESKAFGSASTAAFGTIFTVDSRSANTPVGWRRVKVTVVSSFFSIVSMKGMNCEYSDAFAGSLTRSKEKTTSSTVTGEPSWKTAPSRRVTSTVSPSAEGTSVASAAYTSRVTGCSSVRPSRVCQLTATVSAAEVVIGS